MRHKQQEEWQEHFRQRVHDIGTSATGNKHAFDYVLAQVRTQVYERIEYQRLPFYRQAYLRGAIDAMYRMMWDTLETRHVFRSALVLAKDVPEGQWSQVEYAGQFWPTGEKYS